jgi:Hsp70 protein
MSFGFAIGDFVALGKLAWGLYKQCKGASAEFAEICNEVLSIHTALRELEDEAQNEDSILNRAGKGRQKELSNIVQNCTQALQKLESLVTRYRSLGTSQKKVWDRIKFGDEGIQVIRNQLMLHTSTLTLFLTSLGTGSLGRIEAKLDDIAVEIRAGYHEPSVMTAIVEDTDSPGGEAWQLLSTELAENFSREEIEAYRDEIKDHIRQLIREGALEEQASLAHSEEAVTQRSTSRPFIPSADLPKSAPSSPIIGEQARSRRQAEPIAISDSDSESADSEVQSNPFSDTQHSSIPISKPLISRRAYSKGSTKVLLSHSDTAPAQRGDVKGLREARKGMRLSIGIEIGDENFQIAAYHFTRQIAIIVPDDSGSEYIPTCVAFTEDETMVGTAAKAQMSRNPENTFSRFTCLLRCQSRPWSKCAMAYKETECPGLHERGGELMVFVPSRRRHYTVVELTAILLLRCKELAEAYFSTAVAAVCITTLSRRSYPKLRTLAEAAEIAGLVSPKIVPSAIALAYDYATRDLLWSYPMELLITIIDVDAREFAISLVKASFDGPENRECLQLISCKGWAYGSSPADLRSAPGRLYFDDLKTCLGTDWPATSTETRKLCLLTGSLSTLPSVQSQIQQHISQGTQSDSLRLLSIPGALPNAAKGAVGLALRPVDIREELIYHLVLLVRGKHKLKKDLRIFTRMNRGSPRSSWTTTLKLQPASPLQDGVSSSIRGWKGIWT